MLKHVYYRPYAVVAAVIALIVLGLTSVTRLPVDIFPEINIPVVMVATFYQGFSPEEMDKGITSRIERAFTQASHLDHIDARSFNGVSLIKVFFQPGTDVGAAESELISLENNVLRKLPKGTNPSTFLRFDVANVPVCQLLVHSDKRTEAELYDVGQFTIRPQLASVPGVAIWPSFGGKVREIVVKLRPQALQAYGMSAMDLVNHINASNLIMPGGSVDLGDRNVTVQANTQLPNLAAIDDIPLRTANGAVVQVKDVATTEDAAAVQTNAVRVNGKRSVIVPVGRAQGGNTLAIVDGVRAKLSQLVGLPDDVKVDLVFDQSQYVRDAIHSLVREGVIGGVLAALFMWLVLGDGRATIGVVIAIPLSVIAALIGISVTGQTLNTMTLGGLALSIGTLVDNATVVLENTYRHLGMGKSPRQAALDAVQEVAVPMLAVTACILLVFMPLQYLSGVGRFLFVPVGSTVAMAMGASYLIAMALLPIYCGRFVRGHETKGLIAPVTHRVDMGLDWLRDRYVQLLRTILHHRARVIVVALVLVVASLPLVPVIGTEFFPRLDFGELAITVQAPAGASLLRTEGIVQRVEQRIAALVPAEDRRMMVANIGLPQGFNAIFSSNAGPDRAVIQLQLTPPDDRQLSATAIVTRLRDDLHRTVPEATVAFRDSGIIAGVVNNGKNVPIDVEVFGKDVPAARRIAEQVIAEARQVPGTADVLLKQGLAAPYLNVDVDRTRARLLGLQERDVVENMVTAVTSNLFLAPSYWIDPKNGNDYFLVVQQPEQELRTHGDLLSLPVSTGDGRVVQLKSLARLREETGPQQVDQTDLRPLLNVEVGVAGRDLGAVVGDLQARLAALKLPPKSSIRIAGQAKTMAETQSGFAQGLALAAMLVYVVMVALFRSFTEPLAIIVGVVLSLPGVLWGLWLGGSSLNVQSLLGVLMLIGIAVANSIVLISFAKERHEAGASLESAVAEAGRTRMRPILMTATATILGLLPTALHTGMHAEANTALAQAVIGGLIVATAVTLLVVPALWTMVARRHAVAHESLDPVLPGAVLHPGNGSN